MIRGFDFNSNTDGTSWVDNEPATALKPNHYRQGSIQPIDYIVANNLGFLEGNVIKYVTRYKFKNGVEDLEKAKVYIERLILESSK